MALAATTIWEVESGGNDTSNGGAFDPGQTAGMLTDGAATVATSTAPVFTSASYNFVAGDVGAWVYIASGTNWIPGWYKIASVASNAATLTATIGTAAIPYSGIATAGTTILPSTVQGCATVASPTAATWSIDYSQQSSPKNTYTDLANAAAGSTVTSAAKPFGKQQVGNCLVVTSGTNFTAGRYVIASVAGVTATVIGAAALTTAAGSAGVGSLGGCLATPGAAGIKIVANNRVYIQKATYTVASATVNIATGCLAPTVAATWIEGYKTVRGDLQSFTALGSDRPTIVANGVITTFTLLGGSGSNGYIGSVIVDGNSRTSARGILATITALFFVKVQNCTNGGIASTGGNTIYGTFCEVTGCSTVAAVTAGGTVDLFGCAVHDNTITGVDSSSTEIRLAHCLVYNNTGASSDGVGGSVITVIRNSVFYGNGRDGVRLQTGGNTLINNVMEANGGFGISSTAAAGNVSTVINNATYNNTSGAYSFHVNSRALLLVNPIAGSSSFFTNAAGADFSLNNTANAGALLRATGFPGVMPVGGTGYLDMGALQHLDSGGGGTTLNLYAVE